jgi:hypothetical protein
MRLGRLADADDVRRAPSRPTTVHAAARSGPDAGLIQRSTSGPRPGTIWDVELVAGSTIWVMFSCFLLFPLLGLPRRLSWAAMTLLVAELFALGAWGYGSKNCVERPCGAGAEAGRTAATIDIPLLALALIVLAVMHVRRSMRIT